MGFFDAIKTCFSKYASFEGVATRSEYWWFTLFFFLGALVTVLINPVLYFIFAIVMFLPLFAVAVRRLHDVDRSGWWVLISLVPILGLMILVWALTPTKLHSRWAKTAV